jgi:hypothetical protein
LREDDLAILLKALNEATGRSKRGKIRE